ncbi:sulfotransferase 1B1-like [Branchiostoma lanceolatum]|uniref:sulfotransferase 1B1-like n=1 Tax=Branchiostoma lanceolatum TaxID=7740 RepID=UPI003451F258
MSGRHSMLWTHEGVSLSRAITKETLDAVLDFQIRDDDIVVASFPKTGTNWLAEIAVKILRAAGKTDKSVDSMEFGPIEMKRPTATQPGYITLADMPSPRLVMTHLPVKFAPQGISKPQNKVKVLVPMRNPKDTAVSRFHFMKKVWRLMNVNMELRWEEFVEDFRSGMVPFGDYCDWLVGWLEMRDDPHFLFLKFEDMKKDLLSAVKTIVAFLEVDLDESTVKEIAEASTFDNMKAGLDNSTIAERRGIARKGIIGDWKNTFSSEESAAFDAWCEKKLGSTGLTFDFE